MDKRRRACTPRSRNGCAICRRRRIKCGEERPECQRCRTSGWPCPGYTTRTSHSPSSSSEGSDGPANNERNLDEGTVGANNAPHLAISRYALPFKVPGSSNERRALHYFVQFGARDMSDSMHSDFWSYSILQRCQHAAPLRHATAALGQFHVEFNAARGDFTPTPFAEQCYARAVRSLRNYIASHSTPDHATVLMSAAVFHCLELLRSEFEAASHHAESGLRILQAWQFDGSTSPDCDSTLFEELVEVFARFDLQATLIDNARRPRLRIPTRQDHCGHAATPDKLAGSLFPLLHSSFVFMVEHLPYKEAEPDTVPPSALKRRQELLWQISDWEDALHRFEKRNTPAALTGAVRLAQEKTLAILRLHCSITGYLLQHSLGESIAAPATSRDVDAEQLLDLVSAVLTASAETRTPDFPGNRRFSPGMGVLGPLHALIVTVRDPRIRSKALDLLRTCQGSREGYFDATSVASSIDVLTQRAAQMGICIDDIALEDMTRDGDLVGSVHGINIQPDRTSVLLGRSAV